MKAIGWIWPGSCGATRATLSDLLEGELGGRRKRRVLRHLLRCERCRAVRDSLARAIGHLRSLGAERPASASLADAVVARIRSGPPEEGGT